jgi:SAM-dependent methyltransferase
MENIYNYYKKMKGFINYKSYNYLFNSDNKISTIKGYKYILNNIEENSKILDVGVGVGIYFNDNEIIRLIKDKNISIYCIDIDKEGIKYCINNIYKNELEDNVIVSYINFFDIKDKFDYILFIESFPVIENELFKDMLDKSYNLLNNNGKILLYHNLFDNEWKDSIFYMIKPYLKYITCVDFGKSTTLDEMKNFCDKMEREYDINLIEESNIIDCNLNYIISIILYYFYSDFNMKQYIININ